MDFSIELGEFIVAAGPVGAGIFLILFGHPRLKEWWGQVTETSSTTSRRFANRVFAAYWAFCCSLFLMGAGFWVYQQTDDGDGGYLRGELIALPYGSEVKSRTKMYKDWSSREIRWVDFSFLLQNGDQRTAPKGATFLIEVDENPEWFTTVEAPWELICTVDFTDRNLADRDAVSLEFDDAAMTLRSAPGDGDYAASCTLRDLDSTFDPSLAWVEPAPRDVTTDWLGIYAHAADGAPTQEELVDLLQSEDRELRTTAARYLADHFEDYTEWGYAVIADMESPPALRRNVFWALSRRDPIPRADLFVSPGLPDGVWRAVVADAMSEDRDLRIIARRMAATYPAAETRETLERIGAEAGVTDDMRFQSLLRHFDYNRGVLVTIATMQEIENPGLAAASESLASAQENAQAWLNADPDAPQEALKIRYGEALLAAVGADQAVAGYSDDNARMRFEGFLSAAQEAGESYRYRAQVDRAEGYLAKGYEVFR